MTESVCVYEGKRREEKRKKKSDRSKGGCQNADTTTTTTQIEDRCRQMRERTIQFSNADESGTRLTEERLSFQIECPSWGIEESVDVYKVYLQVYPHPYLYSVYHTQISPVQPSDLILWISLQLGYPPLSSLSFSN